MKKVLVVFGTRPEAVKFAPVIRELGKHSNLETRVAVTAQHREMLDQVLETFRITPDYDLNIMAPNQNLFDITARAITGIGKILAAYRPDLALVQGDTTTTFIACLACYYHRIPVGHVEAGLRTGDIYSPFPEEVNRRLTGAISALHFAPTPRARDNLLKENVPEGSIFVTGNTSIDALLWTLGNTEPDLPAGWNDRHLAEVNGRFVLVTAHRRESFGDPMKGIMNALAALAGRFPSISIVFPVHFNPNVRAHANNCLRNIDNVILLDPLDYRNFAHLMCRSYIILTDSGGIQEEAPSLGKPVLVLRNTTERLEGIEAGSARLVGTKTEVIVDEAARLLTDEKYYRSMADISNPYGDGKASVRIVNIIRSFLGVLSEDSMQRDRRGDVFDGHISQSIEWPEVKREGGSQCPSELM